MCIKWILLSGLYHYTFPNDKQHLLLKIHPVLFHRFIKKGPHFLLNLIKFNEGAYLTWSIFHKALKDGIFAICYLRILRI